MSGLLYKDFCVLKKSIWSIVLGALIFSIPLFLPMESLMENSIDAEVVTFVHMPIFVYFMLFAAVSSFQGFLFEHDERRVWCYYITASPLGYKGQVLSKYFMTLATSFAVVVWGFVCDNICMLISGYYGSAANIYTTFFYIQIILQVIEYPFLIRFGHKHGNTYKVAFLIVAFYAVMIYLLFGKLPENFSMDTVFDFVFKLAASETALPTIAMGAIALLPYVAAILFYLSYKLSCKWYLKGVDAYEA